MNRINYRRLDEMKFKEIRRAYGINGTMTDEKYRSLAIEMLMDSTAFGMGRLPMVRDYTKSDSTD